MTKFILSLPFRSGCTYKERLIKIDLFPLLYLHEYLVLIYEFKVLCNSCDSHISAKLSSRVTRRTNSTNEINIPKENTRFYCRTPGMLIVLLYRHTQEKLAYLFLNSNLIVRLLLLCTRTYNDVDIRQTCKTVCVKCYAFMPSFVRS